MASNATPSCVIWDFDGTIADTSQLIVAVLNSTLVEFGERAQSAEQITPMIGIPLDDIFRRFLPNASIGEIDQAVDVYRAEYKRLVPEYLTLFPGVIDVLGALAASGIPSAVATSKYRDAALFSMESLGISGHFSFVVGGDEVSVSKPDPEMVLKIAAHFDVSPASTLVIGDTTYDIQMGNSAGARTCAVTWGNHPESVLSAANPHFIANSARELHDVIGLELDRISRLA